MISWLVDKVYPGSLLGGAQGHTGGHDLPLNLHFCPSAEEGEAPHQRLSSPKLEYPAKAAQDMLRSLSPSQECVLPSPPRVQLVHGTDSTIL